MTFLPQANSYNKFIFHLYKVLKYSQVAMKIHKKDIVDFLDSLESVFLITIPTFYPNLFLDYLATE